MNINEFASDIHKDQLTVSCRDEKLQQSIVVNIKLSIKAAHRSQTLIRYVMMSTAVNETDLGDWLHTEMVYPFTDGQPSK